MCLVEIVGPLGQLEAATDALQVAGLMHVEEVPLSESASHGFLHRVHLPEKREDEKAEYEELGQILDAALAYVPALARQRARLSDEFEAQYQKWEKRSLSAVAAVTRSLHARVRSFSRRRRNLTDDLRVLESYDEMVAAIAPLIEHSEAPDAFERTAIIFERGKSEVRTLFERQLHKATAGQCEYMEAPLSRGRVAAVVGFHTSFEEQARALLDQAGIAEFRGPRHLRGQGLDEIIGSIQEQLLDLKGKQRMLAEETNAFYAKNAAQLLALKCICQDRFSRLEVVPNFAQTRYTFVIKGWVPRRRAEALERHLHDACGESVVVRRVKPRGAGTPPVVFDNSGAVRPFERLLCLLPLPKYGTVDPSSLVAIFFPPIFGLMLGDIGYGLLLALLAFVLYKRSRGRDAPKELAFVLAACAFFTILFGFFFGEMFGNWGHHIGLRPIWRERLDLTAVNKGEALMGYLILAVGLGAIHMIWGLLLGAISARRIGEHRRAVDCVARIVGLFALFFLVGHLVHYLPPVFFSLGVAGLIAFFVLMIYQTLHNPLHGLMLPLELLSAAGNILSYARIMAVGLVYVVLALLANRFGSMIDNVVIAAIVVFLVHALNLALGIIDPTIQGLRLHYVEFFSTFYVGGGRPYAPFRKAVPV